MLGGYSEQLWDSKKCAPPPGVEHGTTHMLAQGLSASRPSPCPPLFHGRLLMKVCQLASEGFSQWEQRRKGEVSVFLLPPLCLWSRLWLGCVSPMAPCPSPISPLWYLLHWMAPTTELQSPPPFVHPVLS